MVFFFQAEDGIRDLVRSRGLGDVYKRQLMVPYKMLPDIAGKFAQLLPATQAMNAFNGLAMGCLLYTSDAADERSSVDLGGRRIIKKKTPASHLRGAVYYDVTRNTANV